MVPQDAPQSDTDTLAVTCWRNKCRMESRINAWPEKETAAKKKHHRKQHKNERCVDPYSTTKQGCNSSLVAPLATKMQPNGGNLRGPVKKYSAPWVFITFLGRSTPHPYLDLPKSSNHPRARSRRNLRFALQGVGTLASWFQSRIGKAPTRQGLASLTRYYSVPLFAATGRATGGAQPFMTRLLWTCSQDCIWGGQ